MPDSGFFRYLPERLDHRLQSAMLAVIAVVLLLRKPFVLLQPQLIADDGQLFVESLTAGLRSLTWPYADYLLVIPRFAAWLGIAVAPMSLVPHVYSALALGAILFTCARIMSQRIPIAFAWVAALAIPLLPHDGEVYLNVCYIQWTLILAAIALLAYDEPSTPAQYAGDIAVLALTSLSGPFIFPLVPFFWWRALRDRSRYPLVMAVVATAGAILQLVTVASSDALEQHGGSGLFTTASVAAIGTKLIGVTFLGRWWPYELPAIATATAGSIAAIATAYAVAPLLNGRYRVLVVALFAFCVFYVVSAVVRSEAPLNLIPFHHGDRYFFIPRVLLIWSLLLALWTPRRRVAAVLLAMIFLSFVTTFRSDSPRYHDWSQWAERIERREPTTIVVSPYDWDVQIPAQRP